DKYREIFQEFRQLDNPQRDRRNGLGLGLAIVERLVKLLDHRLDLRSQVGKGSMFAVAIPRGQREELVP
ncbi:ATP-binding protein, partial [Pseudomonas aeruginosa]